ncbi:MAG: hypothetical protein FJ000_03380 [Actinobacteria bacterium]|nr:hypothetical protein [Actinomycetota bacterium]
MNPSLVAVDAIGFVYVADAANHRVSRYSPLGTIADQWGGFGTANGRFAFPVGRAVDPATNNVFVTDSGNNRVQKFTSSGVFLGRFGSGGTGDGQFALPMGIAIGPNGKVYVADNDNDRVQRFSRSGAFEIKWGGPGVLAGQFNDPFGPAVNPSTGGVYVVDRANDRIQYFTEAGTYIGGWGSTGSANTQFQDPRGIAVDAAGAVYVADDGNNRVQKFSPGGTFVMRVGLAGPGAADGQHTNPYGVGVTSTGRTVHTTDHGNDRIQRFDLDVTAPSTTIPEGVLTWYRSDVTLTLAAGDDLSGVDVTEYSRNGGNFKPCSAPLRFTSEGVTELRYRSIDKDGNIEQVKSAMVRVDKTGPATKATGSVTARRNRKASFRFRVNDNLAPTTETTTIRTLKGGTLKKALAVGSIKTGFLVTYTWKKARLPKGTYTWKILATDLAGNKQTTIGKSKLTIK